MKRSFETYAYWLYARTGKHFWLYSAIARYKHWQRGASEIERWTERVAKVLVLLLAGMMIFRLLGGG